MPTHRSPGTVLAALLGGGSIALAAALPAGQAHARAHPQATPQAHAQAMPRAAAGAPAAAPRTGDLAADLDAILADARLTGAGVGVLVRDARTGRVRYDRGSGAPLMPASNQKIHTSTAALSILGPGYRFRTGVRADARTGSTVNGNLYLKGTGDPTLRPAEYDRLAAEVAARGITEVTGDLVADDTWFDAERTAPGWDPTDFPYAYAAQISR
ncbi:D-alanyl-D-alanine carboxypeptidase [Actinomadura viridis]|uniref:D-alanyl-D-alanine carboxypeptidase n=1 Tax=Actinomadura viridis TaxID=58110 RepID=UPI0036CFA89B